MAVTARPIVICGPSGVGKGTLLKRLLAEHRDKFSLSVSHTTRAPREGEENGVHYHFTDKETMTADIAAGKFIETAVFASNMYGTSVQAVRSVAEAGRVCLLEIDVQGAQSILKTDLKPRFVFILPPSMEVLVERLGGRGTEDPATVKERLDAAIVEMDFAKTSGIFDKQIVNDDFEGAYHELVAFALGE